MSFGTLTIAYRSGRQDTVQLTKPIMELGSGGENDVVVRDPFVDVHHAQLRCSDRGCEVVDLGSATGTIVDGTRLKPQVPQRLRDGAVIEMGRAMLAYQGAAPAGRKKTEKAKPSRRGSEQPVATVPTRRVPRRSFSFLEAVLVVLAALVIGGILLRPRLFGTAGNAAAPLTSASSVATTSAPSEEQAALYVVATAGGQRLNVRAEPSQDAPVVGQLDNGTEVRAIEGPVEAGGFNWVRIEGGGLAGWSVLDGLRPR